MHKTLCFLFAALAAVPFSLAAQEPPAAPANPITSSEKGMYTMLSGTVIAAAQKMPEDTYNFRPAPEVRTFAQLVGHLADGQYFMCSSAAGEAPPTTGSVEKTKTSKADLITALKEAVGYCTKVYDGMTDAKGSQMGKLMNFNLAKLTILSANTAHIYEHYGNMVTYLRIKGIVPPSSEKQATE